MLITEFWVGKGPEGVLLSFCRKEIVLQLFQWIGGNSSCLASANRLWGGGTLFGRKVGLEAALLGPMMEQHGFLNNLRSYQGSPSSLLSAMLRSRHWI